MSVPPPDIGALEVALLDALSGRDLARVDELLSDDFVITTAGWIGEPADKATWMSGLTEHELHGFDVHSIDVRPVGSTYVALVSSTQWGTFRSQPFRYRFRYTDVWSATPDKGWRLHVRHASAAAPTHDGA